VIKPIYHENIIEKPIYIEKIKEREVYIDVEKIIEVPVEKIIEVPVEVIIERPVIVEKIIEREIKSCRNSINNDSKSYAMRFSKGCDRKHFTKTISTHTFLLQNNSIYLCYNSIISAVLNEEYPNGTY